MRERAPAVGAPTSLKTPWGRLQDKAAKKRLLGILNLAFDDNCNAHVIQADGTSVRKVAGKGKKIRIQQILQKAAEKATKAETFKQSTTFEPHIPTE